MRRFGWIAGLAAALVLLISVWFATREPTPTSESTPKDERARERPVNEPAPQRRSASDDAEPRRAETPAKPSASKRKLDEAERQRRAAVREQILAAQRAREAATGETAPLPSPNPEAEPARPPGNLNKRVEGHDELVAELNRDFMPLADECIEDALARDPELAGMLAIGFEFVVDDELGAVVETVDFPPDQNQIAQLELQECVRETLLSTLLPGGGEDGRDALMLTLEVGAKEDE
ncbi:hypothetical protein ACNOYE_37585 [Nannocystaceae bacterium ST9]